MIHKLDLFDTHAFYGKTIVYDLDGKILEFGLDDFRKIQEQNPKYNIKFLIIPSLPEQNKDIARIVRENRDLFDGAYLHIVPVKNSFLGLSPLSEIERLVEDKEIIGGKIIPPLYGRAINDSVLDDYIRILTKKDLPLLVHCSTSGNDYDSPEKKLDLIKKHPYQKIIFAHLGGLHINSIMETVALAESFENVYLNTTGISGELRRIGLDETNNRFYVSKHESNLSIINQARQIILDVFERIPYRLFMGTDSPFLQYDLHPLDKLPGEIIEKMNENARSLFPRIK